MRIVISEFFSIDGVIQAPGGADEDRDGGFQHGGWSGPYFDMEAMGPAISEAQTNTEALLFGRRTYQTMAAAWPGRAGDPFADRMNALPKYVASRTLTQQDLTWNNSTLLQGDAIEAIRALREREGGDLQVIGCSNLAQQLITAGLFDRLNLMMEPIALGGGKRLFPEDGVKRPLRLVSATTAGTGVLICAYEPAA